MERIALEHVERHMQLLVASKTDRLPETIRRVWWFAGSAVRRVGALLRRGRERR
jgi:hypothetical protein